ncbi:sugar phosphate isomerase [Microbacterium sp. CSI-V]|uniref:sugar phosphate isomerase/epimerase family protein n=1 Tax=unclassified Microbacterium TaxID=2609290 RepID=UPI00097C82B8|nr:TIM barrel protein [Microbacterium sp. CSI-V]MXS74513.1 TIM barrel protein [Microbacterium sp. TL13]ONI63108.1 sugar phosphate isomerase [Microbacterium sp. CSI-V]
MIGLGTYAFFWQHSALAPEPLTLRGAFEATRALDVGLFQICDYAPLEHMGDRELAEAATAARDLGVIVQLGTKGLTPERLQRFLCLAEVFDARLLRSMLSGPEGTPTLRQAELWLADTLPSFEDAGVTLALETYEQVATVDLVDLVWSLSSESLGICLDPANVVARLEQPAACVEVCTELVANVHVKDFAFHRRDGWVGFEYTGAPMGSGLHDYPHLLDTVRPRERGIDEIVEHWLPWQGDAETTVRLEREWTRTTIDYLRSTP